VIGGAVLLAPSLALLFRLVLRGRFDPGASSASDSPSTTEAPPRMGGSSRVAGGAAVLLVAGFVLLTVLESGWAHALGLVCLVAFVIVGFVAVKPDDLADPERR
jgi:cytochrome d ubiquinol oxidase subunit II